VIGAGPVRPARKQLTVLPDWDLGSIWPFDQRRWEKLRLASTLVAESRAWVGSGGHGVGDRTREG